MATDARADTADARRGAGAIPRGWPLRTLLATVWERRGLWVIRWRSDLLALRAGLVAVAVVAATFGWAMLPPAHALATSCGLFMTLVVAWSLTRSGYGALGASVDFRQRKVFADGGHLRFKDVCGLSLGSVAKRGAGGALGRRLWYLGLMDRQLRTTRIAMHGREYALLRAGLRLARGLGVPFYDPEGCLGGPHPFSPAGSGAKAPHAPPSGRIRERQTSRGLELFWRNQAWSGLAGLLAVLALLVGAGFLTPMLPARPARHLLTLGLRVLQIQVVLLALIALWGRSIDGISIGSTAIGVRRRILYLSRTRRIALGRVDGLRLSSDLEPGRVHLDIVGRGRPLARIPLAADVALELYLRLVRAVRTVRAEAKATARMRTSPK